MRKVLVIAAREYKAAVRTKSFIVSLLLMPVLMAGSAGIQILFHKQVDTEDKRFAVVDRTPGGKVYEGLEEAARRRNETQTVDPETQEKTKSAFFLVRIEPARDDPAAVDQQRLELSERVLHGEFMGFVEIGPDVLRLQPKATGSRPGADDRMFIRYQTNRPTYDAFPRWAEGAINEAILARRWQEAGLPSQNMAGILSPVLLQSAGLSHRDAATGAIVDPPKAHIVARYAVPAILVALMFMMVMLASTPAMQGVVEEKMQRIAEVLLGSVRPFELMTGKLLGLMGVSLTVAAVYLTGAYWAAHHYGVVSFLPPELLAWFVAYQVLAVLMYGSLFLAIGAAASDIKETQTLVLPVVMIACIPMFILGMALEDPNHPLVAAMSFFPPVTPMLMLARQATPPGIAWWQPALAILWVVVVTLLCIYAAGRIFRVGILMQGKGVKLGQMVKWVFQG
jgi:ABC-2 type transport system permease protein